LVDHLARAPRWKMPDAKEKEDKEHVDAHVRKRFHVVRCVGRGAYGIVWKVIERETGRTMALKKCFDAFQNATDAQRTFREIVFLQELNGHENIVRLMNVLKADNQDDIYVLFDHMESDLQNVINAKMLTPIHTEYVLYQVLKAVHYMHSGGVLHRDLKPSNVLVNSNCHVRLCDFGLARTFEPSSAHPARLAAGRTHSNDQDRGPPLTDYVATRWYRAPELLLGAQAYSEGVDMWSVGCILGEMVSGKPILKGRSTMNQLERIVELTGKPTEEDVRSIVASSQFARSMLDALANVRQLPSASVVFLIQAPVEARKLILRMLKFHPEKRPNAEVALESPFVEKFLHQEAEPVCDKVIRMPIPDTSKMKAADYRSHIYQLISQRQQNAKMEADISASSSSRKASLKGISWSGRCRGAAEEAHASEPAGPEVPWTHDGGVTAPPTTPRHDTQHAPAACVASDRTWRSWKKM